MKQAKLKRYILLNVLFIALWLLIVVSAFSSKQANIAETQIHRFLESTKQEQQLTATFPWNWKFFCTTGDYADLNAFKRAIGRQLSIMDYLKWAWFGTNNENEDNLIFVDSSGRIMIYSYFFLTHPDINLHASASRGRCVRSGENIFIKKLPNKLNNNSVSTLVVLTK